MRCRSITALGLLVVLIVPQSIFAFGGISSTEACALFASKPQRFWRLRDGNLTYRISSNFKARYPDAFSQYLVNDVARWWEDYISTGLEWKDDIEDRFSYYRKADIPVYELKSVLTHEFGHAVGMQHSDACFYNNNPNTNQPYNANHRLAGGGAAVVQATIGPELMNEIWTVSSPGQKAPKSLGVDGYNRVPGLDDWEFVNYAYPFQSLSFDEIQAGTPTILFDSTDAASLGGQTSYPGGQTPIVQGDNDQGWFIDGVNIWIGNNIGLLNRSEVWFIENNTGSDINQVTMRVNRASTRRAMEETAPDEFISFGAGTTSSPEQLVYAWSATLQDPWENGSTDWFMLTLDVHDWTVQEALMWFTSNQAWPIPIAGLVPLLPWGLTSPNSPLPGSPLPYVAVPLSPSEPSIEPTDIELLRPAAPRLPSGIRAVKLVLPQMPGLVIERMELLPLPWLRAEVLARDGARRRNLQLLRAFESGSSDVIDLLSDARQGSDRGLEPAQIGLRADETLFIPARSEAAGARTQVPPLSATFPIPFGDEVTYAARVTAATGDVRVTLLSLPEMIDYSGTRAARCALSDDASSCCPQGATVVEGTGGADLLEASRPNQCSLGKAGADRIALRGDGPLIVASGDGNDRVRTWAPDSMITLGRGDDYFKATGKASAHVVAGQGADRVLASDLADHIDGGEGPDRIVAGGGEDVVIAGAGNDTVKGGAGDDEIYPGSGIDVIRAGGGDDRVVFDHVCELSSSKRLKGGRGNDILILPTTADKARASGVVISGFEQIVENAAGGSSRIADCE